MVFDIAMHLLWINVAQQRALLVNKLVLAISQLQPQCGEFEDTWLRVCQTCNERYHISRLSLAGGQEEQTRAAFYPMTVTDHESGRLRGPLHVSSTNSYSCIAPLQAANRCEQMFMQSNAMCPNVLVTHYRCCAMSWLSFVVGQSRRRADINHGDHQSRFCILPKLAQVSRRFFGSD